MFPLGLLCWWLVVTVYSLLSLTTVTVGVLLAYQFLPPIPPHLSMLLDEYDLSLPFAMPNTSMSLQFEWRQLTVPFTEAANAWTTTRDFKVGTDMKERGLAAKYPVVLIPGIVSTVRRVVRHRRTTANLPSCAGLRVMVDLSGVPTVLPQTLMGNDYDDQSCGDGAG